MVAGYCEKMCYLYDLYPCNPLYAFCSRWHWLAESRPFSGKDTKNHVNKQNLSLAAAFIVPDYHAIGYFHKITINPAFI
jgi:hypothetical protein